MTQRHAIAFLLGLGLCACGGSGNGTSGPSSINLATFQPANAIIGQSFATGGVSNNGAGPGVQNQSGLASPNGHVANGSLYVADRNNNRIMGWNSVPAGFGANADFAMGVPNFVTVGGGTSATLLTFPSSCWVGSNALFVADQQNERVLIYSPPPTSNVAASVALGKPDLTTQGFTSGQNGLSTVDDVCVALNRIVAADTGNNRVMIWNGIPVSSGANAQVVVGQPDFLTLTSGTTAAKMSQPAGVWTDGTRLVVADTANNRVLIWNTFPTALGQNADLVIGQPDFVTATPGTGSLKMASPRSVTSDGVQLFVADTNNSRVLIYSPFPTLSNAAPLRVLGQSTFTNVTANDDNQDGIMDPAPTARTMNTPQGVTSFGNQLFVTDSSNHRVLIFTGS